MARERHVHLFGSLGQYEGDCTECIEHNDITDALLEACEAIVSAPDKRFEDIYERQVSRAVSLAEAAIKLARGEGHDDD